MVVLFLAGASVSLMDQYCQADPVEMNKTGEFPGSPGKADLGIIFTGSTRGEFEPCGCGGVFEGGFARRAVVIKQFRKANPNALLLDTGDLTSSESAAQTEFISQAYGLLKYDAIALGEGDLKVGREPLEQFSAKYHIPYVASNLHFKTPSRVQEVISLLRGGHKIAVISVISDRWLSMLPANLRDQFTCEAPVAALSRLVPELRKKHDTLILLSHLGTSVRETLADNLTGIDLWIDTGGHTWTVTRILRAGQIPAATPPFVKKNYLPNHTPPLLLSWENDRKVGMVWLRWENLHPFVTLTKMIPLTKETPEDKRFLEVYDAYRYTSRQEVIRQLTAKPQRETSTRPDAFQFVPPEKCGACHKAIYQFWLTTGHSHAFMTLQKEKREYDMNCWACHTTGYREPGGFESLATTPEFIDVGCQDCHRKNLWNHPKSKTDTPSALTTKIQPEQDNLTLAWHCQRCHVPHRSPYFSPAFYLEKINCTQAITKGPKKPQDR